MTRTHQPSSPRATGSVPARGRRHPMTVVTQARRFAEGGWTPMEIVRLLAEDGIDVSLRSVIRWTNPKVVHDDSRRDRERRRRDASQRSGRLAMHITNPTDEFKVTRMRVLRTEARLPFDGIARVMTFDFGVPVTEDQVRAELWPRLGPEDRHAEILDRLRAGKSGMQTALELGLSTSKVYRVRETLLAAGVELPPLKPGPRPKTRTRTA